MLQVIKDYINSLNKQELEIMRHDIRDAMRIEVEPHNIDVVKNWNIELNYIDAKLKGL